MSQSLLACSDAYDGPASWMSRLDPTWVATGIFVAALAVILCVRPLRRPDVLVFDRYRPNSSANCPAS